MSGCRILALLAFATAVLAQAPAEPPRYPLVDPAKRLEGKALAEALRAGGHVLFMRHARQTAPQPQDCSVRNLTPEGEAQALGVGKSLRALRIPIGTVRASTFCRASITARLMDVGPVEETPDLLPGIEPALHAARRRLLAETPKPGTNTLLVAHVQSAEKPADRLLLELAEVIVFKPDGQGGFEAVARVRPEGWSSLE